ncbi:type II secretion system F family protein [Hominifimenecus sp. rT4P-3]|uniref:type II secretion system F family protein n=1 Tax=Hominifimenecus sp. rT4P-3 TaxID=3242979 RepID=UPI003DA697DD
MNKKKISALGISAFCESMTMMLRAGIQTDEAISLLLEDREAGGVLAEALQKAHEKMESGESLSAALAQTDAFPEYFVQMIRLGEQNGQQEEVFRHLSIYYTEQHTISQKLKGLVRYPTVMLIIIVAVLAVMLTQVLPVFSDVYTSMAGGIANSSYRYIRLAYILCDVALGVMLALAVLSIVCQLLWKTAGGRRWEKRILEKLFVTAGMMQCMGLYRFFVSLQILLSAGASQDEAVEESVQVVDCAAVEARLRDCLSRMEEGEGIAQAAYQVRLLEPVYGRMLLAGSRSGNLDGVVERLSSLLQENLIQRVEQLVSVLDPVLSGTMMVTVGFSLLSVMLPLIGMMNSIG